MKKISLILAVTLYSGLCKSQVIPIGDGVFGQNANLTDTVGVNNNAGGKLNMFWDKAGANQNYVKESRVYVMRYGGIQVEEDCEIDGNVANANSNIRKTINDYIRKAIIMQNDGITPMLTLPLNQSFGNNFSSAAAAAAVLMERVNDSLKALGKSVVTHWIYSNEPEEGGFHFYDDTAAAKTIHDYIAAYYNAVTPVWNSNAAGWGVSSSDLILIGPELYNFDNYNHGSGKVNRLIEQLTGQYNQLSGATNAHDITPYIDVFSWHYYPFNTQFNSTNGNPLPSRANVVNMLAIGAPKVGGGNSFGIMADINDITGWLPAGKQFAITEMNICTKNDINPSDAYNVSDDNITGQGANSYIAGQFWAEMMSYAMESKMSYLNFWSGLEGQTADTFKTNIGYLNSDPSKFGGLGGKKPTYHHFKMLSDNFHGNFYRGQYSQSGATPPPTFTNGNGVKSFASVEGAGFKIMVINQNDSAYNFRINFDASTTTDPNAIRISFPNMSSDPAISSNIDTLHYPTSADTTYFKLPGRGTILLTFDCHGIFQSRQDYTEADAILGNGPHFTRIGNNVVDPMFYAANLISCNNPGIGGNINSNTTYSNTTVYVTSNIQINNGELTFDNCKVIMAPGTKIKANPNGSIVLKKSVIFGCEGKSWIGLELNGNHNNGERLRIENSAIYGATRPVYADKIPDLTITKSIFANGQTAIELDRGRTFSITENLIVGYREGLVTSKTNPNYVSEIKDNRFVDMETAMKFVDDGHNQLDVFCNDLFYRTKGIETKNTDLKTQGSSAVSASNRFTKITPGTPIDYIDHNGTPTSYYYGPSEILQFSLPLIVNIPIVQASADRTCKIAFMDNCPAWTIGINENTPDQSGFLIYPNPSSGAFTIKWSDLPKGSWTLNVHDVLGRLISTEKVNPTLESTTLQIASKGMYFVSLQSGGTRLTQKVIVE